MGEEDGGESNYQDVEADRLSKELEQKSLNDLKPYLDEGQLRAIDTLSNDEEKLAYARSIVIEKMKDDLLAKELEKLKLSLDGDDLETIEEIPTMNRKLNFARKALKKAKRAEEDKNTAKELAKQVEEANKRAVEAENQVVEANKRADWHSKPNTFTDGYPALGKRISTSNQTSKSNKHAPVEVVPLDGKDSFRIGKLRGDVDNVSRRVYPTVNKEETLTYGKESDLQGYIFGGFKEAADFAQISSVTFLLQYSLPYKYNEWKNLCFVDIAGITVRQNQQSIMILCTEVKTPYKGMLEDYKNLFDSNNMISTNQLLKQYLGQLYDYLLFQHFYYGVERPYGILHFYSHYIVIVPAFLPCAEEMITKIGLDHDAFDYKQGKIQKGGIYDALRDPSSVITMSKGTPAVKNQSFTSNRKVYISELVECIGEKSAAEKLANVIFVSTQSDVEMGSLKDTHMFAELRENSTQWQLLPQNIQIRLDTFLDEKNWKGSCFQLAFLDSGRDGKCCLACDKKGRTCVLKFFNHCNTSAADEAKRWNEIWGIDAWTGKIICEDALVMPFARTLTKAEVTGHESDIWKGINMSDRDKGNRKINFPISEINFVDLGCLIRQAIKDMAAKGFVHNDLHSEDELRWNHVGLIKLEDKWKCIFIDLSDMRDVDPDKTDDAEKDMLNIFARGCGQGIARCVL
jgi:hypothetical protein